MSNSCVGCKYLYTYGSGYSNYTWEETFVCCALDKNQNLEAEEPYDWKEDPENDNWPKTNESRCDSYSSGEKVTLDVDGEDRISEYTNDQEAIDAIHNHSGRDK